MMIVFGSVNTDIGGNVDHKC